MSDTQLDHQLADLHLAAIREQYQPLARQAAQGSMDGLRESYVSTLSMVFCLTIPAAVGLIVLADDCTHTDLPVYGGENARTPNIDRLATEGLLDL